MKKRILTMLLAIVMVGGLVLGFAITASALSKTSSPVLKNGTIIQESLDDLDFTFEFQSSAWYPSAGTTYKIYFDYEKTTEAGTVVLTADNKLDVTLVTAPKHDTRYFITATAPDMDESNPKSIIICDYRIAKSMEFSYGDYTEIPYIDFIQDDVAYDIVLPTGTASDAPISIAIETDNGATVVYGGDTNLQNGHGTVTATVTSADSALSYSYTVRFTTMNLSGAGTKADPWLITNATELVQLADCLNSSGAAPMDAEDYGAGNFYGYYFKLTSDIDLSGIEWDAIGHSGNTYFAGNFDGGGHTISNLNSTGTKTFDYDSNTHDASFYCVGGLFGWCAFNEISNITVKNANVVAIGVEAMSYAGGIMAVPYSCKVTNCHVIDSTIESGRVPTTNSNFVGGVAGIAAAPSEFEKCSSVNNTVRGTMYVGGFIGSQDYDDSYYTDCYVADTTVESVMVSSSFNCNVGCFSGASQWGDFVMKNCFVYDCTTQVANGANTTQYDEGLLYNPEYGGAVTTNCYYYSSQTYDSETIATAEAKTTEEFADGTVLADLNGDRTGKDAVWMQGEDHPVFRMTYTVTAINGTGGGEYEEGETVTITANAPATGKKFAGWTSEDGVTFADAAAMETTFTMPAKAVTVTANYKDLLPGKVMVNNIDLVNGEDDHTIACGDGTAVYDPDTQTLTLTNAEIITPSTTGRAAGIYIDGFTGTVTVKLVGENEITLTDTASDNNGIWNASSAALAITGDGSLNVLTYNDNGPFGIWNQNSSVTIEDAELEFSLADGSTSNGFLVDAKAITLDGAKLTADKYKQGLFALGALTIQNQATVDITAIENALYAEGKTAIEDSAVSVSATDFAAICIWADLTVENSTVFAHSDWNSAIYCFGLMTISGGKVSATTDEADALNSFGGITIKDNAEVEAAGYYCGVYTNDVLYVESGKLKATGTENRAILARRLSNNAEGSKPTDSADAIVLGNDVIELSGATVKTNDWTYTEVWDDGEDDYVDRWRSSSYFVDGNDTALKEVTVLVGYTVYYTPGAEGAGEADSEIKAPGTPITLESAIYTRTGYTQTGWATTDGGEKAYDLGAEYTTDASVTLYPYWTANEYTVSFDANGGSAIEPIKVTYGEKYGRLPSSSVTGLSGGDKIWYLVDENGSVTETNIQANTVLSEARDHTLFAVRRVLAPTLKITLTAPGCISDDYGYYNPENSTRILTVTVNNKNEDILSYTYQWYKGEEILDGETAATLTLAGNVADAGTYKVTVTATLKQGAAITVSEAAASNTAEKTVRIARAANTLLYDANGGENGPSSNYTGGATITVTDDVPTKEGHKLTGWNTQADGEGDTYASGASYTFANDNGNGGCKVTLYAMWEVEQYTVTLVTNGGTVNAGDITEYTYGVGATLPTNVTRSGYTFKGWYDNAEFDGDAVTEISATDNGNKEFYAKWQKKASGTVVTEHKCTSVCDVCGGCTDAKCTKDVCDDKCLEISMAFKDVAENAWYAESVKYVYHHGIMKGISDTEFDVGGSTTRAMIVTTLWRLEGEPVVNYLMTFEDVKADAYYAEAVRWAASEGLVLGYSAEEFCPDTAITREQMAAIIYRYAQYKNVAPTGAWAIRLEFADVADIAEYAIESVMYCTMKNLMQGRDGGVFAPQATASRAEIAVVLHRFIVNSK